MQVHVWINVPRGGGAHLKWLEYRQFLYHHPFIPFPNYSPYLSHWPSGASCVRHAMVQLFTIAASFKSSSRGMEVSSFSFYVPIKEAATKGHSGPLVELTLLDIHEQGRINQH